MIVKVNQSGGSEPSPYEEKPTDMKSNVSKLS